MEAEARDILRNAAGGKTKRSQWVLARASVALFSGQGIGLEEEKRFANWRGFPLQPISFDE